MRQEFNVSVSRWKKRDCVRVCSVPVGVLVCVRRNQPGYLSFKTTKVKDTKLKLAVRLVRSYLILDVSAWYWHVMWPVRLHGFVEKF